MVPDVLHAHLGLGGFDFDAPAFLLDPDELRAGGAQGEFEGVGAAVDLRPRGDDGFEVGFSGTERLLRLVRRNLERGILRVQRLDPPLVVFDIHAAGVKKLGELGDAGGHRAALAVQVFLLLPFGGDADTDFVEGIGCRALPLPRHLNPHLRLAARGAAGIERG